MTRWDWTRWPWSAGRRHAYEVALVRLEQSDQLRRLGAELDAARRDSDQHASWHAAVDEQLETATAERDRARDLAAHCLTGWLAWETAYGEEMIPDDEWDAWEAAYGEALPPPVQPPGEPIGQWRKPTR